MKFSKALCALAIILASCSPEQDPENLSVDTVIQLPKPTGPYAIASRLYTLVDKSREEIATEQIGDNRQINVHVWYPTSDKEGEQSQYFQKPNLYADAWGAEAAEQLTRVRTNSKDNLSLIPNKKFPVLLYSHGWQSMVEGQTIFLENLASHGVIVIAVNHPYLGLLPGKDDTLIPPRDDFFTSPTHGSEYYSKDQQFALKTVCSSDLFDGDADCSNLFVAGHSSGFGAAALTCTNNTETLGCINIDAPLNPFLKDYIRVPSLLWINTERAGDAPQDISAKEIRKFTDLTLGHNAISDWAYLDSVDNKEPLSRPLPQDKIIEQIMLFIKQTH